MPKVKKNSSVIHPNSRKALQLARQVFRSERLEKKKEETNSKQKSKLTKLKWFRENIDATKDIYSAADVKQLIDRYLGRFEREEVKEDITKSLKRHLNSSAFQDYKSKFLAEKEKQEFEIGKFEIPDLMQKKTFAVFKEWNGDIHLLSTIETVNVSKKQLVKTINQVHCNEQAT